MGEEETPFCRWLRRAIEDTKKEGQRDPNSRQVEKIKELSRQHYERTGASGDRDRYARSRDASWTDQSGGGPPLRVRCPAVR